jgi:hypothetical protein
MRNGMSIPSRGKINARQQPAPPPTSLAAVMILALPHPGGFAQKARAKTKIARFRALNLE